MASRLPSISHFMEDNGHWAGPMEYSPSTVLIAGVEGVSRQHIVGPLDSWADGGRL